MRALSHYWRVMRQDNVVAQALLEKAITIDPNYGQALGLLAASHTFSAHMGWADMAMVAPVAERAALAAIRADAAHSPIFRLPGSPTKCRSRGRRPEALFGRLPPRGLGLVWLGSRIPIRLNVRDGSIPDISRPADPQRLLGLEGHWLWAASLSRARQRYLR
jgi:hypothetical protein